MESQEERLKNVLATELRGKTSDYIGEPATEATAAFATIRELKIKDLLAAPWCLASDLLWILNEKLWEDEWPLQHGSHQGAHLDGIRKLNIYFSAI